MAYAPSEYHPAFEEYGEAIFELVEDGTEVIQARIAERLGISRPAVSEMVHRMEQEGLVEIEGHGRISLTDAGVELATAVVRRHRLAERVMTDVLQLSWAEAHHEAGRWEHVISPVVERAMARLLDDPSTCPHGNPIPGAGYEPPAGAIHLGDLPAGSVFTVRRVPEELECETGQLAFLERWGMMPGRMGTVVSVTDDRTATVSTNEGIVDIGTFAATRILVTACDGATPPD